MANQTIYDEVEIVLASKSPRRKEILKTVFPKVQILSADIEEIVPPHVKNEEVAEYLANLKSNIDIDLLPNQVMLTADTLVLHENRLLGKPKNIEEAKKMLKQLSNNTHTVITGVCLKSQTSKISFSVSTDIHFYPLLDQDIETYVSNYKVLDKAGSYAIQEWIGMVGVKGIEGDFYNVMGLPISRVVLELKKMYA